MQRYHIKSGFPSLFTEHIYPPLCATMEYERRVVCGLEGGWLVKQLMSVGTWVRKYYPPPPQGAKSYFLRPGRGSMGGHTHNIGIVGLNCRAENPSVILGGGWGVIFPDPGSPSNPPPMCNNGV